MNRFHTIGESIEILNDLVQMNEMMEFKRI